LNVEKFDNLINNNNYYNNNNNNNNNNNKNLIFLLNEKDFKKYIYIIFIY